MSDEYIFDQNSYSVPIETRVLVEDRDEIIWKNEEEYSTGNNTLSETFMTADETGDNSTQYFSVLETSTETILNDMSQLSMDITRVPEDFQLNQPETEEVSTEADNENVILFRVDGSDEIYSIQVAQDEAGNMQKYQFQVQQNADGQFEPIPGTVEIIPMDNESIFLTTNNPLEELQEIEEPVIEAPTDMFVKQEEQLLKSESVDVIENSLPKLLEEHEEEVEDKTLEEELHEDQLEEQIEEPKHFEEQTVLQIHVDDSKEGLIENTIPTHHVYINDMGIHPKLEPEMEPEGYLEDPINGEEHAEVENQGNEQEQQVITYQRIYLNDENNYIDESQIDEEEEEEEESEELYQEHFIKPKKVNAPVNMYISQNPNDDSLDSHSTINDFESDEDFLDGIPVTGEDEVQEFEHIILDNTSKYERINYEIKDTTNISKIVKTNGKGSVAYIIRRPEKENVEAPKSIQKVNPRSILKTALTTIKTEPEYEKRFAKGKVAVQARQFQNYISQTKIIEAPVRQERLPRKQKIKPLERSGEEIVVQEVTVSSNGFIQISEDGVVTERKRIIPTECIQLSDSEDDQIMKIKKRKRKSKKKQIEIVISDTEEENPEKEPNKTDEETEGILDSKKEENKCSKCPKTFPSIGSLKTHMQYHNFEESNTQILKNIDKNKKPEAKIEATKYQCSECKDFFKNNILLSRHASIHQNKSTKIECGICKKLFTDRSQLITHKRTHVKEQMFKTTNSDKISPKKKKSPPISRNKEVLKCTDCSRTFNNAELLTSHMKSHKRYPCATCSGNFASKILFDNHLRNDCLKSPAKFKLPKQMKTPVKKSPINKRISYIPRKSSFRSPVRTSKRLSVMKKVDVPKQNLTIQAKCDSCDMVFTSHRDLLKHKVSTHGLDTPDKSIGKEIAKKSLVKPRGEHSGVPPSKKLKNAFAGLKSKLEQNK